MTGYACRNAKRKWREQAPEMPALHPLRKASSKNARKANSPMIPSRKDNKYLL